MNAFTKHVGAPTFAEARDVLLRTKAQDEDKIAEMFAQIKKLGLENQKLLMEIEELARWGQSCPLPTQTHHT